MLPAEIVQIVDDGARATEIRNQIQAVRLDAELAVEALETELRTITHEPPRNEDPLAAQVIGKQGHWSTTDRAILRLARLAEAMKPAAANSQYARRAREEVLKTLIDLGVSTQAEVNQELGL